MIAQFQEGFEGEPATPNRARENGPKRRKP